MSNYNDSLNQREIYKLVEQLTTREFNGELDFLNALVEDIIHHPEFEITGGRVWELHPEREAYELRYQTGNIREIPKSYTLTVEQQPILRELTKKRTALSRETDELLIDHGIAFYSVTGVGDIVKIGKEKYYKWVLGFNADYILQSFYETLSIISSVATITLKEHSVSRLQKKIHRDIVKAAEIQKNLIPEHYLEFYDYKIYGVCLPDSDVGGDYFDYLRGMQEEEDRLGILISDAASKGLSAAIQALFVSGAVRMAQIFSPRIATMLYRLNNIIFDTFPYERFVTLFYCELTLSSNRLVRYANAGHCAPIHYSAETGKVSYLRATGGLLGIMKEQKFKIENVSLMPGDILVLYTDGLSEAQNNMGELFGEDRIVEVIRNNKAETPKNITLALLDSVVKFADDLRYSDDKTIVVIKRDETTG